MVPPQNPGDLGLTLYMEFMMKKLFFGIFLGLFSLQVAADTPSQLIQNYYSHLEKGEFVEAATYIDPAQIKLFRESIGWYKSLPEPEKNELLKAFFGPGATEGSVDALTDAEFFSTFLAMSLNMMKNINIAGIEILGSVEEGEDVLHFVSRTSVEVEQESIPTLEVISLRKGEDDQWRILLSEEVKGLGNQMRRAIAARQGG